MFTGDVLDDAVVLGLERAVATRGHRGLKSRGARQSVRDDRKELLVEGEANLGFVHAPITTVFTHDARVKSAAQEGTSGECVTVNRSHRVAGKDQETPDRAFEFVDGRRELGRVRPETLKVKAIREKLPFTCEDHAEWTFHGSEFVDKFVQSTERIKIQTVLALAPDHQRDVTVEAQGHLHTPSI